MLFAWPGMVLATAFVCLPFVVREVVPVLEELGTEQEQAAAVLGAGPVGTFARITLPAMRWALIYGVVLSSARALGEFGAVSIVSGNVVGQTQALPLYVEDQFNNFDLSAAHSTGLLLAVISVLIPDRDDLAHPQMPQGTRMSIQAAAISKSFGDFRALSDVTVTISPAS